jgi:hypothetical protein
MPSRKARPQPSLEGPQLLREGMPTRLLPYDWPFLYSVLANGDLVVNKRLPLADPPRRQS